MNSTSTSRYAFQIACLSVFHIACIIDDLNFCMFSCMFSCMKFDIINHQSQLTIHPLPLTRRVIKFVPISCHLFASLASTMLNAFIRNRFDVIHLIRNRFDGSKPKPLAKDIILLTHIAYHPAIKLIPFALIDTELPILFTTLLLF